MDAKLVLVKAITVVYLQSKLATPNKNNIKHIIDRVLEYVKPVDRSTTTDFGNDVVTNLRETLIWMYSHNLAEGFDEPSLKQRFAVAVKAEQYLLEALMAVFDDVKDLEDAEIQKRSAIQIKELYSVFKQQEFAALLKELYIQVNFNSETIDWATFVEESRNRMEPFTNMGIGTSALSHGSVVNVVDFDDPDKLAEVFENITDELHAGGTIKTPYQALNRAMGTHGGIRRGEMGVIYGLQHSNKSGICLDLFAGCALYNKPYMHDESKKPLNLRISFENDSKKDVEELYMKLYAKEYGVLPDMSAVTPGEAAAYVQSKLSVNGYHNELVHIDPSEYTYLDLFDLIEDYESRGYEVHFLTIDYLNMMSKKGCNQGPHGEEIRDLFRRVRNFINRKSIALFTPHQLSSDAKSLKRQGLNNFLGAIVNKGYSDGSKRIDQEVDFELLIDKIEVNGVYYMAFQRGKHRGQNHTPASHMYFVYQFDPVTYLPWDVEGADMSRKTVGGDTMSDGGRPAWFSGLSSDSESKKAA